MRLTDLVNLPEEKEIEAMHTLVGANVKRLRKKRGVSQLELAVLIGHRSPAFLANAENNARNQHFNLEHLYKIAKALEVSMSDFFFEPKNEAQAQLEEAEDTKVIPPANVPKETKIEGA